MPGKGEWAKPARLAREMIDHMGINEKVRFTGGVEPPNGCHGFVPEIEFDNITFPGLCLADAGNGLRGTDFVSSFPSGIHTGASWNRDLTRARAAAIGAEFRKKGVNVLLGPVVGPLGRLPVGGRNWEGFSNDPYLAGALAYETVQGIQDQGVIASTKHFIGNEQETHRMSRNSTAAVSSNLDDRTLHELYAWPFQDALRAGTGAIMCSYQRVNNSYGCANSLALNGLLKTELGFEGFVVSDWDASKDIDDLVRPSDAGLDMEMPRGDWTANLLKAVVDQSLDEGRVDDMVQRVLAPWIRFNNGSDFLEPGYSMPKSLGDPHEIVDARDPKAGQILFDSAVEGHVLVKNEKNTLPLNRLPLKIISIFGYSAKSPDSLNPGMDEIGSFAWKFGAQSVTAEEVWSGFNGKTFNASTIAMQGTLLHGGGSSAATPSSFVSPFDALRLRAFQDETMILHDFVSSRPVVHAGSDVCIVFGNAWASESYDRPALRDDYTDGLIKHVADQCEKTIVIFHNAGVRLVDVFVEHLNVTAVVFAHFPGEQTGNALTALLYGDENFSGKLPYTVPRNESHYGHLLRPDVPRSETDLYHNFPQSEFTEGLFIDYRHFEREKFQPRYDFGFGLSYTTFELSALSIHLSPLGTADFTEWPTGEIVQGGREDLWDPIVFVYAQLENIGSVAGAEVAQLYLSSPNSPPKQLRGFIREYLEPGESIPLEFRLTRRDASIWNVTTQEWQLQQSLPFNITVGTSRGDTALEGSFSFPGPEEPEEEEEEMNPLRHLGAMLTGLSEIVD